MKTARPFFVVALLAIIGACTPTTPEPAVTPVAALPEPAPPMMVPPIAPSPTAHAVHTSKRLSTVKKHKNEHKVVAKSTKQMKVAKKHHKKKHHTKVAKASKHPAPGSTKLASRAKPAHASVPLDAPPAAMPAPAMPTSGMPAAPMAPAPSPLSAGMR